MARLSSSVELSQVAPDRVWQLVTDWPAHSRWIPLTAVSIDSDSPVQHGLGTRFTGRSGLFLGRSRFSPIGFDDPMTVTGWQPPAGEEPGRCRVVKRGRWLSGWAEIEVRPVGAGSLLVWTEDVWPRWTPKLAAPVVTRVGALLFDRVLRRVAAELAADR